MNYKINQIINIYYLAKSNEIGLTDLLLTPTTPGGVDETPISFTEIGNGIYKASFYPDEAGQWYVRITSITSPDNNLFKSYMVEIPVSLFEDDDSGNTMPSDANLANFEKDGNGDLMPLADFIDYGDLNFELDSNEDIVPKE